MVKENNTTIQISERLWIQLNGMKGLGDTFDDVIVKLLPKKMRPKK